MQDYADRLVVFIDLNLFVIRALLKAAESSKFIFRKGSMKVLMKKLF